MVSLISGMPAEDYIQSNIIDVLELDDTFCNLTMDDSRRERVSCTYFDNGNGYYKYWDNSWPQSISYFRGCGGMYSTVTDYARILEMWMDMGIADTLRFLTPETVELALTPTPLKDNYAMHWALFGGSEQESLPKFGHGGYDGTKAWADPGNDLMVMYFTQSSQNSTLREIIGVVENALGYEPVSSVRDNPEELSDLLLNNYPNPFSSGTTIKFNIDKPGHAIIKIYNIMGQEIETLANGQFNAGINEVQWIPNDVPGGMYFVNLEFGGYMQTKKLILGK